MPLEAKTETDPDVNHNVWHRQFSQGLTTMSYDIKQNQIVDARFFLVHRNENILEFPSCKAG